MGGGGAEEDLWQVHDELMKQVKRASLWSKIRPQLPEALQLDVAVLLAITRCTGRFETLSCAAGGEEEDAAGPHDEAR